MTILSLSDWLECPQGQYLLQWEQAKFDLMVSDIFGYNAVQIGLPQHDFLRSNRIPFRLACAQSGRCGIIADPDALPFATASVDLVLLPHVLEFSQRPHHVLREVERVLVPEGSVIISGFNPFSLWGLRRLIARGRGHFPWCGQYLSVRRAKDWLALLGFETQGGSFGCYAPPFTHATSLEQWRFMDKAGDRWWPICGGAYILQGIKRVQGMRLITPNWRDSRATTKRLSPVAQRGREVHGIQKTE
ncbi:class I SAM-dependent methyltransferase [Azoarcus sp. KH32C]|uniref:class I SAM-dependent methyltransferase n=1 Tax=Azoarcus sp. KH32C TaxID=748247 RepID=UPI0002386733|nr:class I SAM-dependent methyltransferase [Azoarcus sp. KH32C]BAL24740.1 generic methyl-transferase [Azoarcus sp. KH32C]